MKDSESVEEYAVRVPKGFLTPPDDTTVGGEGNPYAGIGNSVLPEKLRHIGEQMRQCLFKPK